MDIHTTRRVLTTTHIGDKETMKAHFNKMRNLRAEFEQAGGVLTDSEWLAILQPSYVNPKRKVIKVGTHRSEFSHNTVENFENFILALGKLEDDDVPTTPKPVETAFRAQKSTTNIHLTCVNCKRMGHTFETCRQRGGKMEMNCINCKKYGHIIVGCYEDGGGKANQRPSNFDPRKRDLQAQMVSRVNNADEIQFLRMRLAQLEAQSSAQPRGNEHVLMASIS